MKLKEFRLDVEALFSQAVFGHGFLHYGYWEDGKAENASLEALGKAQRDYFEKFHALLPEGVSTALDVGSGTGSNAAELTARGVGVDCVCPSASLNRLAENKLPLSSSVVESRFEDFRGGKTYDVVLFIESFHYLDAEKALRNGMAHSDRYLLIFDYFRKKDGGKKDRLGYRRFRRLLSGPFSDSLRTLHDEDVTPQILPTFDVLDTISNLHLKPFVKTSVGRFAKSNPVKAFLLGFLVKKLLRFAEKKSDRHQRFAQENEYRLILLEKTGK